MVFCEYLMAILAQNRLAVVNNRRFGGVLRLPIGADPQRYWLVLEAIFGASGQIGVHFRLPNRQSFSIAKILADNPAQLQPARTYLSQITGVNERRDHHGLGTQIRPDAVSIQKRKTCTEPERIFGAWSANGVFDPSLGGGKSGCHALRDRLTKNAIGIE